MRVGRVRARTLEARTESGPLEVELAAGLEEATLGTASGGVTVRVPAALGATYELSAGSGGVSAGVPVQVARQERSRLLGRVGDGRARVRVSSGSGDVRLEPVP